MMVCHLLLSIGDIEKWDAKLDKEQALKNIETFIQNINLKTQLRITNIYNKT
jgi:hypothetical protein